MNLKIGLALAALLVLGASCSNEDVVVDDFTIYLSGSEMLPEKKIAFDKTSGMQALYHYPTTRYKHGVLGDSIEAESLMVIYKKQKATFPLDTTMVFEDIQPRLADLDGDSIPEIVTILTSITKGASVTVFKFSENKLTLLATSGFIGTAYKWLNIAAIDDLDNDGQVEIVFVSTPHTGGYLHFSRIEGDLLRVYTQFPGVSNHKIGSRNLCLSAITESNGVKTLYLPSNDFTNLLGFQWKNNKIIPLAPVAFTINPEVPLTDQYNFEGVLTDNNCINAN
jgi:hypothetical protein